MVLGGFGTNYTAVKPNKDCRSNHVPRKRSQKNQENHATINNVEDDILWNEPKIVSAVNHEAPVFLESDYNENDLYQM